MFDFKLVAPLKLFLLLPLLLVLWPSAVFSEDFQSGQDVELKLENQVVSFDGLKVNEQGQSCLGVYTRSGMILTSESCLKTSIDRYNQNITDFLVTRSGQSLQIDSREDFQLEQGIGLVSTASRKAFGNIDVLSNDEPISTGSEVTIYGYSEWRNGDIQIEPFTATVSLCIESLDLCYIDSSHLTPGAPVFIGDKLLCIGSETPGNCDRAGVFHHRVMKRDSPPEGCRIVSEGGCTVKNCDKDTSFCRQCYDKKDCTVKVGNCDGKTSVQVIECSDGANCVVNLQSNPPFGNKCTGGECTKGACGRSCQRDCTVYASTSAPNEECAYECDIDPIVYYISGGISGGILLIMGGIITCALCSHYMDTKGHLSGATRLNNPGD